MPSKIRIRRPKVDWKAVVLECQRAGDHLQSCDDDGYCNACGYQETVRDPKQLKGTGYDPDPRSYKNPERVIKLRKMAKEHEAILDREAKRHAIEDDTPILPWIVAECVVRESFEFAPDMMPGEARAAEEHLTAKAAQVYGANADFRKKIRARGNKGRDTLYAFMRHWLSAWIKDHAPELWPKVPESFKVGVDPREGRP